MVPTFLIWIAAIGAAHSFELIKNDLTSAANSSLSLKNGSFEIPGSGSTVHANALNIECYQSSRAFALPIDFEDCIKAVGSMWTGNAEIMISNQEWLWKRESPRGIQVPALLAIEDACSIRIADDNSRPQTLEASMLGIMYYAGLIIHACPSYGKKLSYGGRFELAPGGFYVDLINPKTPSQSTAGNITQTA